MRHVLYHTSLSACLAGMLLNVAPRCHGQQDAASGAATSSVASDDQKQLFAEFEKRFSGTALVGQYTVDGKGAAGHEERYEIKSVKKLPYGDYWLFTARVKYGNHDRTLPMPLNVKWAGKTPVITLDEVTIPVLGTFSARVVLDGKRYAGTWQHGEAGGHMFGRIERIAEDEDAGDDK